MFMTEKEDMRSERRQKEFHEVVTCLKNFKPTKVALEVLQENEEKLNDSYVSYKNGYSSLSNNEVDQLGFRLAKQCNLNRVSAVAWNEDEEGIPDFTNLGKWEQTDAYKSLTKLGQEMVADSNTYFQKNTLKEYLLWLNEPRNILKGQEMYMKLALVGDKDNSAGAIWTAKYWYYRNMLIYKNLVSLIDLNQERIFVLYGSGHLHLLLQFIKESGLFDVKLANDYLN
jgi:hypothetical protein